MHFPVHNQEVKPVILLFFGIPYQDPAKHTKAKKGGGGILFLYSIKRKPHPDLINGIYQH